MKEGATDIDTEGVNPISKFIDYIPLCKGKEKVPKDLDAGQFLVNTPLLLENLTFEGMCLSWIPHFNLKDFDLADHERLANLSTNTYMKKVFYKESGVTVLEPVEWICGVN